MAEKNLEIRPLALGDYSQWRGLWDANNQGCGKDDVTAETWRRLMSEADPVHGLAACVEDRMAGLLHYVLHPVTGHIAPVCYMQDVFVAPDFRRRGIARALVETLAETGKDAGWARIYWLAENDNVAAQALYRTLGVRLNFSLYILPL